MNTVLPIKLTICRRIGPEKCISATDSHQTSFLMQSGSSTNSISTIVISKISSLNEGLLSVMNQPVAGVSSSVQNMLVASREGIEAAAKCFFRRL